MFFFYEAVVIEILIAIDDMLKLTLSLCADQTRFTRTKIAVGHWWVFLRPCKNESRLWLRPQTMHWYKRKQHFFLYIRKFRRDGVQSHMTNGEPHIWLNICVFLHILGNPSSYMTLHPIHSEFPYLWGNIFFLFYQCAIVFVVDKATCRIRVRRWRLNSAV